MKRTILLLLLLILLPLGGCFITEDIIGDTLTLTGPSSCYPPCLVTLVATGVTGGQYTFEVEGKTYTGASDTLAVRLTDLPSLDEPLIATVRWSNGTDTQTATIAIALSNRCPVIGEPSFNGLYAYQFCSLVQYQRYVVESPDTYDPEGGPVYLVDVDLRSEEWGKKLAIFCPPHEGANTKPGVYHVKTKLDMIDNAFVFYGYWEEAVDPSTKKPIAPIHSELTYPSVSHCTDSPSYVVPSNPSPFEMIHWPTRPIRAGVLVIKQTWADEKDQRTVRTFRIPIAAFARCGVQSPSSVL